MSNRPYKNVKRFVDGTSKEIKKAMKEAKEESNEQNKDNTDDDGKTD